MFSFGDTNHPQKLVDVVTGVPDDTAKNDKNIIDIQSGHDFVGSAFVRRHRFAYQGDVTVVPRIVVHQGGAICHTCYLITVIPPENIKITPLSKEMCYIAGKAKTALTLFLAYSK